MNLETRIREKLKGQRFMHHIGFEITKIEEGRIEGEMPLNEHTKQQLDFLHGGVTLTVSDIVMGFAALTKTPEPQKVVTAELKLTFLNPGVGDRLRAVGYTLKSGSKLHFCEAEVYVFHKGKEILIAKSSSTMAII
jgi:uncharacterized protein (TIGR00369 family)